jgi:3-hydroxyacyl-CoA dehydrogenase
MRTLRRVAVLGAGTMGSRIAAHFANAGVPVLLLDIVLAGQPNRNATALKGIENAIKQRPPGFFTDERPALITPGNLEDDLHQLADCDWVVEAIVENLDAKRDLWHRVETIRKPDSILSTNTSGIPLAKISAGFSPAFRRYFLGTHFFNPPRYLHLMELIPGVDTSSPIGDSAKVWSAPRTHPTSSPTASAVFSVAPSRKRWWKTTSASKKWTRSLVL